MCREANTRIALCTTHKAPINALAAQDASCNHCLANRRSKALIASKMLQSHSPSCHFSTDLGSESPPCEASHAPDMVASC